jgi:NAD(P)-dependent dehydrogenase (short-subunit alcohol dehydrogenase family)
VNLHTEPRLEGSSSHDKVIVVTGAASGIGAATTAELARRGARVLAVDLQLPSIDPELAGQVVPHQADVSDSRSVKGMIDAAVDRFGVLDGLFNNAGIFGANENISEYPDDAFARVLAVNVQGVFYGMKHAIPALRANGGGAIVNMASVVGIVGGAGGIGYVASKHAVMGLTRAAAVELARENIRVNALCPGPTETAMMGGPVAANGEDDPRADYIAKLPTGRFAQPDEIAQVAAWLLLDAPLYLTGAPLIVDGAVTAE